MKDIQILNYIVEHQNSVTTKRLAKIVLNLNKHFFSQQRKIEQSQKTIEKLNARCQRAEAQVKYLKSKKENNRGTN